MIYVVDTNVPIVANGKSEQASPGCVVACSKKIKEITEKGMIAIDDQWMIIKEYQNKLRSQGEPGLGDYFLKWVLTNCRNSERCVQVAITCLDEKTKTRFEEFPNDPRLKCFDPSDRKFIAVSVAHPDKPPILQAVDSKWWKYRNIFKDHNVTIVFLCLPDSAD